MEYSLARGVLVIRHTEFLVSFAIPTKAPDPASRLRVYFSLGLVGDLEFASEAIRY